MRQWLWKDVFNNMGWYHSPWLYLHAVASVVGIFAVCTVIDMVRKRVLEKPFMEWLGALITKSRKY